MDMPDTLLCPPSNASVLPDGSCSGNGQCNVVVSPVPCGPGVIVTTEGPSVWQCSCVASEWDCMEIFGSLGLVGCNQ
jgi:hypothetical protein